MLLVDSNKRITLAEIRQLPWFQEGLPSYLAKPARRRHVSDVTNSPTSDGIYSSADYLSFLGQGDDVSPHTEGSEWVAGLGYLEPEALKEVVGRYSNDYKTEDELVHALKEGKDKRIKIAYQLCADSYRAKLAGTCYFCSKFVKLRILQPLNITKEGLVLVTHCRGRYRCARMRNVKKNQTKHRVHHIFAYWKAQCNNSLVSTLPFHLKTLF